MNPNIIKKLIKKLEKADGFDSRAVEFGEKAAALREEIRGTLVAAAEGPQQ